MSLRDDLRTLADWPLDRGQHTLLAGALLALITVAVAGLVIGRADGDPAPPRAADPPASPTSTPEPAVPAVAENELLEPPPAPEDVPLPDELLARHSRPLTASDQRAAERAGRRFTRAFLRYQARQLDPEQIAAATGELRSWVAALPRGRGTPAVRQNPARLRRVRAQALDASSAVVTATVERLGARYPLRMTARELQDGRWLVTALQSDPDATE